MKKITLISLFLLLLLSIKSLQAQSSPMSLESGVPLSSDSAYPLNLLMLDDQFSHHVIVAEKSTHQLHLFQNDNGIPRFIKTYQMATGKFSGNKSNQGDKKTPEGIYLLTQFLNKKELLGRYGQEGQIYGAGAFVLNYPNVIDQRSNKTGSGIWLHSTDDESRISKGLDSKGCVVVNDNDLRDISRYIELDKTSIIIVQELLYVRKKTWESMRSEIKQTIDKWVSAWKNENIRDYMDYYDPREYGDHTHHNYVSLRNYKQAVFSGKSRPQIQLSNLSVLIHQNYSVVQFIQDYSSNKINDSGKKTLYLKKDNNYQWKIVAEYFDKSFKKSSNNFNPSPRFF